METEIEAKFPDIDADALRAKLAEAGATRVHGEILMRRHVFDYPDNRLDAVNGWVRVRDEGSTVTMSYKQLVDRSLHGTKEVNVTVDDYDAACAFLKELGLVVRSYQETKREKWMLGEVEVTIDTWPWVPTFAELEGPSEEAVRAAARALELDWNAAMHGSVETVYQMHYDVTEAEIDGWEEILFTLVPEWLEAKRKA